MTSDDQARKEYTFKVCLEDSSIESIIAEDLGIEEGILYFYVNCGDKDGIDIIAVFKEWASIRRMD